MSEPLTSNLDEKAFAVRALLGSALREHNRVVYSSSLGSEAMVLTDIIWSHLPDIDIFTIDTGRLHEETYDLLDRIERRYQRKLRVVYPDTRSLEGLVSAQGINGFYESVEARKLCCNLRKVAPFVRAIAEYSAWITGIRRGQSAARSRGKFVEWDSEYGLYKISPLLEWTEAEVWAYIRARQLLYNPLHDRQFPTIGCSPCTRAIQPGEGRRSGRWWWEPAGPRECGLHPETRPSPTADVAQPISV
jgi:phosphoadenosine phosphosulfate reductase